MNYARCMLLDVVKSLRVPDKIISAIKHDDKSSKVFRAIFMCIFNKLVTRGTQNKLN